MDQLLNPSRSTVQYLPQDLKATYEIVLNEIDEWKMLHPSIIGLICGQYPNDRAKRTSTYLNILANGAGQSISFQKRSVEEDYCPNKKVFKPRSNKQPSNSTHNEQNNEHIDGQWPILNGYLLIGASNMRRMAEFQLHYKKDATSISNQIGSCVGGWKIANMVEKIKTMANIEKIVVMAGTNNIINNCNEESLDRSLEQLSIAIAENDNIKEAIMVQPPPLPYHSSQMNQLVQRLPETLQKLAKTNNKMKIIYTWDKFTEDRDKYKVELFTNPGNRFKTSIHLNWPGTVVLKRVLIKATSDDMDLTS